MPKVEPGTLLDLLSGSQVEDQSAIAFRSLDVGGAVVGQATYAELRERCFGIAAALSDEVPCGQVVVLLIDEGLEFVTAFFACLLAGAIPAAMKTPRHVRDRARLGAVERVLEVTRASAILVDRSSGEAVSGLQRKTISLDSLASQAHAQDFRPQQPDPQDCAYLQFTSGSTSDPKGVALSHENVIANLSFMSRVFEHDEPFHAVGWLPLFHDMGLVGHVLLPLYEGGSSTLMSPATFLRDPAVWLQAFGRYGANGCAAPPFALNYCLRKKLHEMQGIDLSACKYVYVGSEEVRDEVLDRFAGAFAPAGFRASAFRPSYGLAEGTLLVAGGRPRVAGAPTAATGGARKRIGYAIHPAHTVVRIVDPQTGFECESPEEGEIWISGRSVSGGYFNDGSDGDSPLAASLPGDERTYARTGDLGFIEDGQLYISGRLKDIVIVRGMNYVAEDLEHTLATAGDLFAAGEAGACFALPGDGGEGLHIIHEVDRHLDGERLDAIVAGMRSAIVEGFGIDPAGIRLVPAGTLPRTANGKISRHRCRVKYLDGDEAAVAVWPSPASAEGGGSGKADDVVVIGMACSFPGGANRLGKFWDLLANGVDAISEVPPERWDNDLFYDPDAAVPGHLNTKWGGFVDGIDQFDPNFFGISEREAIEIDPQQRMLLETGWRLFENAGLPRREVEGSKMGVYVGVSTNDYLYMKIKLTPGMEGFNAYSGLGNANSIAANRLSYLFGLRGPSMAVDTACSSSLTAFHLAVQAIKNGDCDIAISGGVNAILSPGPTIALSQFGMMAPDGRCKTFDASADGYVRAEGCGLVMLKRRSHALRDGDQILATVRATAVGQDGHSEGITAPDGSAQRELIEQALGRSGLGAGQIGYIEAHGTGTSIGDPIEIDELKATYGQRGENGAHPCHVGAVKANLGHLEAGAGIAGVIKAILVLQHRTIPPQVHLNGLNPRIDLSDSRLQIPSELTPWPVSPRPRCAAVSSFGFGGANAHVILEEGPERITGRSIDGGLAQLFTLSASSGAALRELVDDWLAFLKRPVGVTLADAAYWQAVRRTAFDYRLSFSVSSMAQLCSELEDSKARSCGPERARPAGHAFIFPGQGEHYGGMASGLHERFEVFREAFDRCHFAFGEQVPGSLGLRDFVLSNSADEAGRTALDHYSQLALFAVEYALAELWMSWGIRPTVLIGHSLGEFAAACIAGCFEPEDGIRLLIERTRLVRSVLEPGSMAVLFANVAEVEATVGIDDLAIAAVNSPDKTVLSGAADRINQALARAEAADIRHQRLSTSHAFHSPEMDGILDEFAKSAGAIVSRPPSLPWISTVTGEEMTTAPDGQYWANHLRQTVQFSTAVQRAADLGCSAFLQVGPGASLLPPVWESLGNRDALLVRSLEQKRSEHGDDARLLQALGELFCHGSDPDWEKIMTPSGRMIPELPGHPFLRKRCWIEAGTAQNLAQFAASGSRASEAKPANIDQGKECPLADWLYSLDWVRCPLTRDQEIPPADPKATDTVNWIVIGGDELGDQVGVTLKDLKYPVFRMVTAGGAKKKVRRRRGVRSFPVSPAASKEEYEEVLNQIINLESREGARNWRLLYLGAMELDSDLEMAPPAMEAEQDHFGSGNLIRLMQAVMEMSRLVPCWVVTRASQCVQEASSGDDPSELQLAQTPVWGLGKTLFLEHPEIRGGLIDIGNDDPQISAAQIIRHAWDCEGEHAVAFRNSVRLVEQLVPKGAANSNQGGTFSLRTDGLYLITGGLGGLGLRCARWLASRGVTDIVLVGRRPLPDRESWGKLPSDDPAGGIIRELNAIESSGGKVRYFQVDLRDDSALDNLFSELRQEDRPIRGVLHAAGVNWFAKIRELDTSRFLETLRIKVAAAIRLHHLTANDDLDCFILFSSVSALWGSVELGHYTAANHFLDSLSRYRQGRGLPSLSVDWGPWAEVGMSAKPEETELLGKLGFELMPPDRAIEAMERCLADGDATAMIADLDWEAYQPFIDYSVSPALFAQVQTGSVVSAGADQSIREQLEETKAANAGKARAMLEDIVRAELGSVLLLDSVKTLDADHRFNFLGMDSLMAIAFSTGLERTLAVKTPNALAYNYPTIRAVVDHLYELIFDESPPADTGEPPVEEPADGPGEPSWYSVPESNDGRTWLFVFPYSGIGESAYHRWGELLSADAHLVPVHLPGRDQRPDEAPAKSIYELAGQLADHFPDTGDAEFVFFGHSLGALIALELTRELQKRSLQMPAQLLISGCGVPASAPDGELHTLPDAEFVENLGDRFETAELGSEQREIAERLLPLLRADVEMLETYFLAQPSVLPIPITVFGGDEDLRAPRDELVRWAEWTSQDYSLKMFPGGHDFIKSQENQLTEAIRKITGWKK